MQYKNTPYSDRSMVEDMVERTISLFVIAQKFATKALFPKSKSLFIFLYLVCLAVTEDLINNF